MGATRLRTSPAIWLQPAAKLDKGTKDVEIWLEGATGERKMNKQHDSFLDTLPNGWDFDRLKDVVALRNEKTDEASADEDYLELEDLESGTGRILSCRNTLEVESAVTLFRRGDVLFGKLRPYLEKYYEAEFDGKCTGEILAFKPERIASRFLFYCVGSRWFIERCNALAYGAKMPRVSWPTQLSQFNIPLPPMPEQWRIAAYLDASCAAIDAAVAAKRRQLDTLDALGTTLVYEMVTQGINRSVPIVIHNIQSYGQTPKHWKQSKLRYEISIQNGDFASDKLQDGGAHPILGGNGVMGHTDLSNVDGETIVIGRVGAYCGNAHYVQGKAWVSDNALIVKSCHHARFLCHLFNALNFNAQANSTAQPVITGTKIKNTYVMLPPLAEQQDICAYLDKKLGELKRIVAGIETQITTLTAYRKSLIHECVTGQRRVTEGDLQSAGRAGSIRPVERRP
jgi:type I restriction enzyme S subunit